MLNPDYQKRGYLLPKGCKDLIDAINLQKEKLVGPSQAGQQDTEPTPAEVEELEAELEREAARPSGEVLPISGEILLSEPTTVAELAAGLGQKAFKVIADLMELGVFADLKQSISFEVAAKVARRYGYAAKRLG